MKREEHDLLASMLLGDVAALECPICNYRNEVAGVEGYEESATHIVKKHFKISKAEWATLPFHVQSYIIFTITDRLLVRKWRPGVVRPDIPQPLDYDER